MTNPLVYVPKKPVKIEMKAGVNTSSLGGRGGDLALAKGVADMAKATGALKLHLDTIDDTNQYSQMTSSLEIEMGEALIGIESNNNPDTYAEDVDQAYQDITKKMSESEWKTTKFGLAWNGFTEQSKAKYMKAADRKQANMRIDRALIGVQDSRKLAGQKAAQHQDHTASQWELEGDLAAIDDNSVGMSLEDRDVARAASLKVLRENDWYYAEEQISQGDPQVFLDEWLMDEKKFFAKYKYLGPGSITKLRNKADQEIKYRKGKKADEDKERETAWHKRNHGLRKDAINPKNSPAERAAANKNREDHLELGADAGVSPSYIRQEQTEIYSQKVKYDPHVKGQYIKGIHDNTNRESDTWWTAASKGLIKYSDAEHLDGVLKEAQKNEGMVSQWDKIDKITASLNDPAMEAKYRTTMEWVQRETGWSNSDPRMLSASEKLYNSIVTEERWYWDKEESIYTAAYADKPWDEGDRDWKFRAKFDPTIPSADETEIAAVDEWYKSDNDLRVQRGDKEVPKNTGPYRQWILNNVIRK